jgi:serine/threonine protein kinase
VPSSIRPGDVLADRYRLVDLLTESGGGRFWRAHDRVLERHVALHVIAADDERADALLDAARRSATVHDRRLLRVLDADIADDLCYVVNEWGSGDSLDIILANGGPLGPRRAAWLVSEVAASLAAGHEAGIPHGRLVPENVLVDHDGAVRLIGFAVDAAMHGVAPGRISTDVADLGGVLYCALTGKWPGPSQSTLSAAPTEQGQVLRPRRVRAGIPRPLDALCDEVINPYDGAWGARLRDTHDVATAQGIADYLCAFVGDPTGLAAAEAAAGHRGSETITLPAIADPPVRAPDVVEPEPQPEPEPEPADQADLPTEAGLPIFDDENDDVSWITARSEPAPPPPPFEEPPERPLFAPEPADGPSRRPRSPEAATGNSDYWPWDHGSASTPAGGMEPVVDDEVPGRSWLRLAAVIAACLLLLVAIVVAYNLGRGRTPLGAVPEDDPDATSPSAPATSAGPAQRIDGVTATDFDPQGDPPREESPELAPLAVDGKPGTSWRTSTYFQNFGPGGIKSGVGLILDLGETHDVAQVDVTFVGAPTSFSLYVTAQAPTGIQGLDAVLTDVADGPRARAELDQPATGRFVTLWLTSLPEVEGGFRAEVAEVTVRG